MAVGSHRPLGHCRITRRFGAVEETETQFPPDDVAATRHPDLIERSLLLGKVEWLARNSSLSKLRAREGRFAGLLQGILADLPGLRPQVPHPPGHPGHAHRGGRQVDQHPGRRSAGAAAG